MNSIENIVDEAANIAILDGRIGGMARKRAGKRWIGKEEASSGMKHRPETAAQWAAVWSEGTDAVMDVPVGGVCEVLYGH